MQRVDGIALKHGRTGGKFSSVNAPAARSGCGFTLRFLLGLEFGLFFGFQTVIALAANNIAAACLRHWPIA